jgi:hypothetical protein
MKLFAPVVCLLLSVACTTSASNEKPDLDTKTLPSRTTGPYVSVAVDNHFHDVHPVDHREMDTDRPFVVRNEGKNLHNVSFGGTKITEDIKPGESFEIDPASKLGALGTYKFFCKYHVDQGMRGEITLVDDASP